MRRYLGCTNPTGWSNSSPVSRDNKRRHISRKGFYCLMLIVILRTLILYLAVVVVLRIMGKREVGQLQPYELVVAIMIAELGAIPMEDKSIPLINGLLPIFTLLLAHVSLAYISLRSDWARGVICGTPSIVIRNGKIMEAQLRRLRYNINELLEQLRSKNVRSVADVEFAVLETNGTVNVILKSQKRPLCAEDMGIETSYEGLPLSLVVDGVVKKQALQQANLTEDWLKQELKKAGIDDPRQALYVELDTNGSLLYQQKGET